MLHTFTQHINHSFPFIREKKILLACSGGTDSMVLAHLFFEINKNFSVAHCNFKLRGNESDTDEEFVKQWAKKHKISVYTAVFNTKEYAKQKGISTQMAARELRYNWFYELAEKYQFDYIATAHHLDDDLETFFINLSRGSGIKGLIGIPAVNDKVIRPLLPFSRQEIEAFAIKNKIAWREDSSNKTTHYLRNKLRHTVLPQLKEITPQLTQNFKVTKQHLQQSNYLLNDYISLVYSLVAKQEGEEFYFDIPKIKGLPNSNALLYELLFPFGFTNWEDVYHLLDAQSGKYIVSENFRVIKNRDVLLITKRRKELDNEKFFISEETQEIAKPLAMRFIKVSSIQKTNLKTVYIDNSLLKYPLVLRKWQKGDYFYPFGMKGKKKLSKFFKDEKLSLAQKEKAWVLTSKNKIIWVVGYRADERFKVTESTNSILKIDIKQ